MKHEREHLLKLSAVVDKIMRLLADCDVSDLEAVTVLSSALALRACWIGVSLDDTVEALRSDAWQSAQTYVDEMRARLARTEES